jgi:hypothetical protein
VEEAARGSVVGLNVYIERTTQRSSGDLRELRQQLADLKA